MKNFNTNLYYMNGVHKNIDDKKDFQCIFHVSMDVHKDNDEKKLKFIIIFLSTIKNS